jgi:hypothetical protein
VGKLSRVFLEMNALDSNPLSLAVGVDVKPAAHRDRMIELGDLVALHQIRVEIVLSIESTEFVDRAVQRQASRGG